MIFAEKLILLRKKAGWSQEELAEQMEVTRQSVSKWEGAQSVPDLEKMVRLSRLFGVSTDYLLKEEAEELPVVSLVEDEMAARRRVSMEEASDFLAKKEWSAWPMAYATLLCILSPVCLLLLGAISEHPEYGISENMAGGIGMIVLLTMVAIAVAIFLFCGSRIEPYLFLEKEDFDTEYGVVEMVRRRQEQDRSYYTKSNVLGCCLCIGGMIPFFAGLILENDILLISMLSVSFLLVGIGVVSFVHAGVRWGSYQQLLQEGDYTSEKKARKTLTETVITAYWLIATAIFLAISFRNGGSWDTSWVVWPVAGVLFPALLGLFELTAPSRQNRKKTRLDR